MKCVLRYLCLRLAVKICTSNNWAGYLDESFPIRLADQFYNWIRGAQPGE